jgi:hypothetical protein
MVRIGEEIPQKIQIIHHIRPKYACKRCEESSDEERPAVRIAQSPLKMIAKGIAFAGLLASIITY